MTTVDTQPASIEVLTSEEPATAPGLRPRIDLRSELARLSDDDAITALRDQLTAEGVIASLGIGRNGFHPRFLLNPDVCPLSCC